MSDNDGGADFLQGLTFTPGWAKAPADRQRFDVPTDNAHDGGADSRERRPRHDGPRDRRAGWADGSRDAGAARRPRPSARPAGGDFPADRPRPAGGGFTADRPRPAPGGFSADRPRPFTRAPDAMGDRGAPRFARDARPGPRAPFVPAEPVDYPVEIRFLPEPKALAVVVHKVARGHRAFPIRDLAKLFLDNPTSCEVRMDLKPGQEGVAFHQCSRCGWLSLSEAELREHAFAVHFEEEFASETVEGEPPTGTFVCVARCGITGKLLAPPNHHSYNQRVQEMLRTECRNVSEDAYRARIEIVHDAELVQKWREAGRQRTVYRRKVAGGEPGAALERAEADALFTQELLPAIMTAPKHVSCAHAVAMQVRDRMLSAAVQDAWRRELRYPASLFFALRGAFRHKHMHVFRAGEGKGIDFVMSRVPAPLDVQHAVPELKAVVDQLTMRPACTRAELLSDLGVAPEGPQTPEQERIVQQLKWVTERGHVIEYFNGVLALPEEHPVFRFVPLHHTEQPHPRGRTVAQDADRSPPAAAESASDAETAPQDDPAEPAVGAEAPTPAPASAAAETAAASATLDGAVQTGA